MFGKSKVGLAFQKTCKRNAVITEMVGDDIDVEFAVGIMFVDILQDGCDTVLRVMAAGAACAEGLHACRGRGSA